MLVPIPALIIIEAHSPSKRSMSLSIVRLWPLSSKFFLQPQSVSGS
jgi:hypothetical protein